MPDKKCPVCNVNLELRSKGYAMGSPLSFQRFHADIYSCPKCRRVRLYAADENLVVCPVCGHKHHPDEQCIVCALNRIPGGSSAS